MLMKSIMIFFRRAADGVTVSRDADRLMRDCGEQAYEAAGDMSWREDAGLMTSDKPGHWHRVQVEIGRRTHGATVPQRRPVIFEGHENLARLQ